MNNENKTPETGVYLESLTWPEAEVWINRTRFIALPLGAAAKEHGPHLPLNNDAVTAQWLAERIRLRFPVLIAPLLNTSYYPAFAEYPGSISLSRETACRMLVETCQSLASFGCRRFYTVNTGLSTELPLSQAQATLHDKGIELRYLQLSEAHKRLDPTLFQQEFGSHADEYETSLMLYIAPDIVKMEKAVDDGSEGEGNLSRTQGRGIWSASGVYGRASLASREKGELVARALLQQIELDIHRFFYLPNVG